MEAAAVAARTVCGERERRDANPEPHLLTEAARGANQYRDACACSGAVPAAPTHGQRECYTHYDIT